MESKVTEMTVVSLDDCLQWLCSARRGNNFYGRLINVCRREKMTFLPTACVSLDHKGHYKFMYHEEWFYAQDINMKMAIIIHEAGHIALNHLERGLALIRKYPKLLELDKKTRIINYAQDLECNDVVLRNFLNKKIVGLNQESIKEQCFGQLLWPEKFDLPKNQTMEKYLELLLKQLEKEEQPAEPTRSNQSPLSPDGKEGDSGGTSSGKSITDKLDEKHVPKHDPEWTNRTKTMSDAEIDRVIRNLETETKGMMKRAAEQTKKGRGTIPSELHRIFENIDLEPTIPWNTVFQGLLKSSLSSKLDESTAYPNPSLLEIAAEEGFEPYPGYQKNFTYSVMSCADVSGSVNDDEYKELFTEVVGMCRQFDGLTLRYLEFDYGVQHERMVGDDDVFNQPMYKSPVRHGRGGTSFVHPLRRACGFDDGVFVHGKTSEVEGEPPRPDVVVILTDGGAPVSSPGGPIPTYDPGCPVIWVITKSGTVNPAMHRYVQMN